jgi:hypothetical protein
LHAVEDRLSILADVQALNKEAPIDGEQGGPCGEEYDKDDRWQKEEVWEKRATILQGNLEGSEVEDRKKRSGEEEKRALLVFLSP